MWLRVCERGNWVRYAAQLRCWKCFCLFHFCAPKVINTELQFVFFGSVWATWVRPSCRVNEFNDLRWNYRKYAFALVLTHVLVDNQWLFCNDSFNSSIWYLSVRLVSKKTPVNQPWHIDNQKTRYCLFSTTELYRSISMCDFNNICSAFRQSMSNI